MDLSVAESSIIAGMELQRTFERLEDAHATLTNCRPDMLETFRKDLREVLAAFSKGDYPELPNDAFISSGARHLYRAVGPIDEFQKAAEKCVELGINCIPAIEARIVHGRSRVQWILHGKQAPNAESA